MDKENTEQIKDTEPAAVNGPGAAPGRVAPAAGVGGCEVKPSFRMIGRAALALWCLALAALVLAGCQSSPSDKRVADEVKGDWATITPAKLERLIVSGEVDPNKPTRIDIDETNRQVRYHPIILAIGSGNPHPDVINVLVKHGADVNAYFGDAPASISDSMFTALEYAMIGKNIKMVKRLLELGANPNAMEKGDTSPLANVIMYRGFDYAERIKMVDLLLEYGADLNAFSYRGESPKTLLMDAVTMGLDPAIEESYIKVVRYLLSRGARVNVSARVNDDVAVSAMGIALMGRNAMLLDELIEAGGDVNITAAGDCKPPLFYFVAMGQSLAVFDALLLAGADINYACPNGDNILSMLEMRKHTVFVYEMLKGAYPADKFPTEESWIAYGDVILDRIKSLCEERRYKICDQLDKEMTS